MTTYLKVMNGEDLEDSHPCKPFTILTLREGETVSFLPVKKGVDYTDPPPSDDVAPFVPPKGKMTIMRNNGEIENWDINGNIYVMNEAGRTIATHTPAGV